MRHTTLADVLELTDPETRRCHAALLSNLEELPRVCAACDHSYTGDLTCPACHEPLGEPLKEGR